MAVRFYDETHPYFRQISKDESCIIGMASLNQSGRLFFASCPEGTGKQISYPFSQPIVVG
jgi:hypothetical protein